MATFHHPVEVGPRDGSRRDRVRALVDTGSTYAVMPTTLLASLGIAPQWTGVFELPEGRREERPVAEVRLRIDDQERTAICVFGRPTNGPILGSHTLASFGLAADLENLRLVPARLFLV